MAVLTVVHATAGRLRLRLPASARSEGVAEAVQQHAGVVSSTWSARTRSLLVLYHPDVTSVQALVGAVAAHIGVSPEARAVEVPRPSAEPAAPVDVAQAIRQTVARLNASVGRATGGAMDLRTLLPLALAIWALRQIVRGGVTPIAWSTALWYAHGLFRDYNLPSNEG